MRTILIIAFCFGVNYLFAGIPNAEIINYVSYYTVKHNVLYETCSVTIKINNENGDDFSKIGIDYSENSKLYGFSAWIEDMNGTKIRKLKKKNVTDKSNISDIDLYDDNCIRSFELKHSAYPYIIKYVYSRKRKDFRAITYWSPVYNSRIPTLNAKLVVNIPAGYEIAHYENKIGGPVMDSSGNRVILTWSSSYEKLYKAEAWSPREDDVLPVVVVIPIKFKCGIDGTQQDWIAFGNWFYNLNKGMDELPEEEKQKVHEMIQGEADKKLIVKKLYQYLQDNTRYISIQIGIGGMKSYPASYVTEKKYGDCKALSNYMKALLKAAGIKSDFVLIHAGKDVDVFDDLNEVAMNRFNHVLLLVPLNKDSIWLECTSSGDPCGYQGTFTQNRYALIVDENNSRLIKTPFLAQVHSCSQSNNKISIDTASNIILRSTNIFMGSEYDKFKMYSTTLNNEKQKEYLEEILPYRNFEVQTFNIEGNGRDSAKIQVNYTLLLKNPVIRTEREMYFHLSGLKLPQFELPAKRHLPVVIPVPIYHIDTTFINIPDNYRAKNIPDYKTENQFGLINVRYTFHDKYIEVYRTILVKAGKYSLEQYVDFYQFITRLQDIISPQINLLKNE